MSGDGMLKLGLSDPDETPESPNKGHIALLLVFILLGLPGIWMVEGCRIQKEAEEVARKSAAETEAQKAQQQRFQSIETVGKLNKKIAAKGGSYAGMAGVAMADSEAHDKFIVGIAKDGMLAVRETDTRIQLFSSLTETFQKVSGEKMVQIYLYYGTQHICTLIGDAVLGSYIEGWGCDV